MVRVAVAMSNGEVFRGHFAHAPKFVLFNISSEGIAREGERENPLGSMPDHDAHGSQPEMQPRLHGIPKYEFLRNSVLNDVDVVVVSSGCMTSIYYFLSQGVKLVFVDEDENPKPEDVANAIARAGDIGEITIYTQGRILEVEPEE